MELFVLMKLEGVFETFLDEQDAVNSFFPDRSVQRFDILAFIEQQSFVKEGFCHARKRWFRFIVSFIPSR
jgi:hypothetical protein